MNRHEWLGWSRRSGKRCQLPRRVSIEISQGATTESKLLVAVYTRIYNEDDGGERHWSKLPELRVGEVMTFSGLITSQPDSICVMYLRGEAFLTMFTHGAHACLSPRLPAVRLLVQIEIISLIVDPLPRRSH